MKKDKIISKAGDILHHAFFLEIHGQTLPEILQFIGKSLGVKMRGNPDVSILELETFGIDDARALQEAQFKKSWGGKWKIFIISAFQMTREAQSALLKVFEEPTPGTHFFVLTPSLETLLPTLRSRMQVVSLKQDPVQNTRIAREFLRARPANRLATLKPILEEKNKTAALKLLNGLEQILHQVNFSKSARHLEEIIKIRGYLGGQSPSLKILMEHLAVTLPVI